MVEIKCKGFTLRQVDGKLYIERKYQTFRLRGLNNNTKQLQYIINHIKPTSTMTDLVGLFYTRDNDGYIEEQLVEMYPVSHIRKEQSQYETTNKQD